MFDYRVYLLDHNMNRILPLVLLLFLLNLESVQAQKHVVGLNVLTYSDIGHNSWGYTPNLWSISGLTYELNTEERRYKFTANYERSRPPGDGSFARRTRRTVLPDRFFGRTYQGFNVRAGLHNPYNQSRAQFLYGADLTFRGGWSHNSWEFGGYYASQLLGSSFMGLRIRLSEFASIQTGFAFYGGFQLADAEDRFRNTLSFNFDPVQSVTVNVILK